MDELVFHRMELAQALAEQILDTGIGSAASSGLFLAAPRRTGKSTFIREDLRPALQAAGAVVIYVDLWSNRQTDPGVLIEQSIRQELSRHAGIIGRLAKSTGMEKVSLGGVAFAIDKVGLGKDISLSIALAALSDEVRQPIALLIDEAQHAITTEAGYAAMFALKAARDELNSSAHHGLRIVATGSNRDKLAMLKNSRDQAFFGAPLVEFPTLGKAYVQWFCSGVKLRGHLDADRVFDAFKDASYRPELLAAAAQTVKFDFSITPEDVPTKFEQAIREQISAMDEQTLRIIRALTPLQSAVLTVLAFKASQYAPFDDESMRLYRVALNGINAQDGSTTDTSNIQQALVALQEKGLIWKEKRGVYSLEEASTADVLASNGYFAALETAGPQPRMRG